MTGCTNLARLSGGPGCSRKSETLNREEICPRRNTGCGPNVRRAPAATSVFLGPETLKAKFIGDEKEIDILCPMCGTKTKGKLEEEGEGK